jgi:hypothetical protein
MSGDYGLNDSLEYLEFEFDSFDSDRGINASVSALNWPLFLLGRPLTDIASIKILEVQIPFSYYVFTTANNTFKVVITLGGDDEPTTYTVTIPIGNYTASSFVTNIITALNAATGISWTVTYSNITNKITYSTPQPTVQPFLIDSTNNLLTFVFNKGGVQTLNQTVTIANGIYANGTLFAAAVQTALNNGFAGWVVSFGGGIFTFTWTNAVEQDSGFLSPVSVSLQRYLGLGIGPGTPPNYGTISGAGPFVYTWNSLTPVVQSYGFIFGNDSDTGLTNPRLAMGFAPGFTNGPVTGGNVIITSNSIQITGPNYIYVNSSLLGSSCKLYLPQGNDSTKGTLSFQMAKIPVNCNPNGVINWIDPDPQKWYF